MRLRFPQMKKLLIIGIGPGDADYVTIQAVKALNRVDVFFIVDKGSEKDDLVQLRREILGRYIEENRSYRVVEIPDPERDRRPTDYQAAVHAWRQQRADRYEQALHDALAEDEVRRVPGLGRPGPLRQHHPDRGRDHRAGQRRARLRSDPRD